MVFFCEICEIFKNTFFNRTSPVAVSVIFSFKYLSFMWQGLMGEEFWSHYFHFLCSILWIRFIATAKFWKKKTTFWRIGRIIENQKLQKNLLNSWKYLQRSSSRVNLQASRYKINSKNAVFSRILSTF